ncbi:hypothetical protein [Collimonas sp. OK607]|uniref:hypothetical protein n=1 Tax=Collimonas sp. OK607 TaxID=1798194 RepID=UPI00147CDD0C|nr:hypothetical protein [Collimonas sp. OK607]
MMTIEVSEDRAGAPVVSILQLRNIAAGAQENQSEILATTSGNNARQNELNRILPLAPW